MSRRGIRDLRLVKPAPELLAALREGAGQLRGLLQSLGAFTLMPKCCPNVHWAAALVCGCACHKARAWLRVGANP
jgi:hypothetical protein